MRSWRVRLSSPGLLVSRVTFHVFLLGHHGSHFGFADNFCLDKGLALHLPKWPPLLHDVDLESQSIAWHDRLSKLRAIDTGQIHRRTRHMPHRLKRQHRTDLSHRFENQYPRHDGTSRKMPLKEGFIDRDVLNPDDPPVRIQLLHAIDQEKGIPVRQQRLNFGLLHHRHRETLLNRRDFKEMHSEAEATLPMLPPNPLAILL